ncbi:glycosyltransferase [uncultured Algibacter sp.]|uniref:glycosyltransferase n=1 Tax=uncultured Algibacter sp. TaxID=298659 RepID=UPI0026333BAA|nr:glycosyltransferase [uncultured Algibacter sp.]
MKVRKKALIITYYWPPAGGPGVQRWLKFVKYLPDFNVEPIVYIPENPNYAIADSSLLKEVSDNLHIIKRPIKEPYKLANLFSKKSAKAISKGIIPEGDKQSFLEQFMLYIRGNFFIPDARKNWVKPSIAYLSQYISENNIETIITTGPPHSVHLIGLGLKESLGVKWLADFRDPWTTIGYHKELKLTKKSQKKHKILERKVLNSADQVIVTSFATKKEFKEITEIPITVITNGYDKEKMTDFAIDSKFTLAHIGSLLSQRNPLNLWKALSELIKENDDFAKDFQLNLIGSVSDEVINTIRYFVLSNYLNNIGYVSHKEAIKYQKKSQVLLLVEINSEETRCIIPGKLFEYMISNRPIIAVGPKDSDVEKIIKETNTGDYFLYDDFEVLKNTILKHYKAFKMGELQSHAIGLQKYSRKELTKLLAELI